MAQSKEGGGKPERSKQPSKKAAESRRAGIPAKAFEHRHLVVDCVVVVAGLDVGNNKEVFLTGPEIRVGTTASGAAGAAPLRMEVQGHSGCEGHHRQRGDKAGARVRHRFSLWRVPLVT